MAAHRMNMSIDSLRNISSAFSRMAFMDVLKYNDYSYFNWLLSSCDTLECNTYIDLLKKSYSILSRQYRCEYVYKNELIQLLLGRYGTNDTMYLNEFRVGKSRADIVMFNGESKAFEIKTEYDTPHRLSKQLNDYRNFFDKCYIVIPSIKVAEYSDLIEPNTGIISVRFENGHILLNEEKKAQQNNHFESEALFSCLRTEEYKNIVAALGYSLEGIPGYELFTYCNEIFQKAERDNLRELFLREIKKRENNTSILRKYPSYIRQMMLSLNLSENKADHLIEKLNISIF